MADLTPSSGGPPSRRSREQRAYRLVVTGGVAAAVAVVGAVLAAVSVFSWAVPVLAAIIAVICLFMFRRTIPG
jgi:fatty acid desaturase